MISFVVVSHSRALAEAARELAAGMTPAVGGPHVEVAAGLDDGTPGTDASAVAQAMLRADEASGGDGTLVLLDLGSAVLATELALELVGPEVAARVRLSAAPLVEGLVVAVVTATGGGDLQTCADHAERALGAKAAHLTPADAGAGTGPLGAQGEAGVGRPGSPAGSQGWLSAELSVVGEHGLHARPAARIVATLGEHPPETELRLTNRTSGRGPVDGRSITAVATLDARRGHVVVAEVRGPRAQELLDSLHELAACAFGDLPPVGTEPLADVEVPVPASVSTEPGVAGTGLEAAVGPAIVPRAALELSELEAGDPEEEQRAVDEAVAEAVDRLAQLEERAQRHLGHGEAEVFAAHAIMLHDPELQDDVSARIRAGAAAPVAWRDAVAGIAETFSELPDAYQRERATDVRSVGDRVLRILRGAEEPEAVGRGVLVVDDLDPALAISLDAESVLGVVTRSGSGLGHGVLIARSRGVPVLTGVGSRADVPEGTVLAFDVRSRRLEVDPPPEVRVAFEQVLERRRSVRARALADAHLPARTRDGHRITVRANVSSLAVARLGAGLGAEGCGLVRTEAVFAQWTEAPTVQEQVEAYEAIAAAYRPHRVTFRTWDVGGDKSLSFLRTEVEDNPFLGIRGLRAFCEDPTLLLDQLEAICTVATRHPVTVTFPMVTTRQDVDWARDRLHEAAARGGHKGLPPGLGVGIMVEVPAVALRADRVAQGLDLISIGSNDLSQYTLAAERGNPRVAPWSDPLDPSVLQLIRQVCDRAPEGVVVSLCGEMAADPDVAALLVGLGVREISSTAASVPMVKARLRASSLRELQELAVAAEACGGAVEVRALLDRSG